MKKSDHLAALKNRWLNDCRLPFRQKGIFATSWWRSCQQEATALFASKGIPTNKVEAYRYTPWVKLAPLWRDTPVLLTARSIHPLHYLRHLTGHHELLNSGVWCKKNPLPSGLHAHLFSECNDQQQSKVQTFWAASKLTEENSLVALNRAAIREGLLLEVTSQYKHRQPLYLHRYNETPQNLYECMVIELAPQTHLQLVEIVYAPSYSATLHHRVLHLRLGVGATLEHYVLQTTPSTHHYLLDYQEATLAAKSQLHHYLFNGGPTFSRNHVGVHLLGSHAETMLQGAYVGKGKNHTEHRPHVVHAHAHTSSKTHYRGAVRNYAKGVFNGLITVCPDAPQTVASQHHHAWLLNKGAHVYARPELDIRNKEVICHHGATMAPSSLESRFYLQSRGLSLKSINHLLLEGFFREITQKVPLATLKPYVEQALLKQADVER